MFTEGREMKDLLFIEVILQAAQTREPAVAEPLIIEVAEQITILRKVAITTLQARETRTQHNQIQGLEVEEMLEHQISKQLQEQIRLDSEIGRVQVHLSPLGLGAVLAEKIILVEATAAIQVHLEAALFQVLPVVEVDQLHLEEGS